MSSHREAPEISKDPVADSTDLYAFVSQDRPGTVTLIANYIPLESPAGGPNFYEFGNDVRYEIHVDNDGDGLAEITYQFRFQTKLTTPGSFLDNTGPIRSLGDPNWNSKQFYSVARVDKSGYRLLGRNLPCPPCNVGDPVDPALRGAAWQQGRAHPPERDDGLCRAARRGVLCRPWLDLRPRQPAPVPAAERLRQVGRAGQPARSQRDQQAERAFDRDPGPDLPARAAGPGRPSGSGPPRAGRGSGSPPTCPRRGWRTARSRRSHGWAIR